MSFLIQALHASRNTRDAECLGTLASSFRCKPIKQQAIQDALQSASFKNGTVRPVFDLIKPAESVCIVVSDHTRKTAAHIVLPVLLKGLEEKGCSHKDFFFLFASGIHRSPTKEEIENILGRDLAAQFAGRIFFHEADKREGLVSVGKVASGHEVFINRKAVEADRLILTGSVTYHYHAGFGGGRKAIVPGIAGRETIAWTHSLTIDPREDRLRAGVEPGMLDGNPVSEAMLEAARLCEPDFIINTVLTPDGKLAGVFAGNMDTAHRAACRLAEKISRVDISRQADFVIASAGPATNWIQSHKAFYNAHRAVHEKGWVILDAPCPEGLGNERFRQWVKMRDISGIFAGLRRAPEVLGQTALSTRLRAPRTILVTRLNQTDLTDLGMRVAGDLDGAVKMVLAELASASVKKPSYYLMPEALYLVPFLNQR
jgi:nickel-dependent lactate racemase